MNRRGGGAGLSRKAGVVGEEMGCPSHWGACLCSALARRGPPGDPGGPRDSTGDTGSDSVWWCVARGKVTSQQRQWGGE